MSEHTPSGFHLLASWLVWSDQMLLIGLIGVLLIVALILACGAVSKGVGE